MAQKAEKREISLFWKGLIVGLLGGILGDLFVSYLMKVYDSIDMPLWSWIASAITAYALVTVLIWFMWRQAKLSELPR